MEERKIIQQAISFARENKKSIVGNRTNVDKYKPDEQPVSVFMAGSPGAGKTEFSINLLETLEKDNKKVIRIDPDDLRKEFPKYTGNNSDLFQPAVSILVDAIHDKALYNKQNFIFDGTLSDVIKAKKNIKRSLDRNREVEIVFVFQRPEVAWKFTQERENEEGRMVPKEAFIDHCINSQKTADNLKQLFGSEIDITFVLKDLENNTVKIYENISQVENYLPKSYTRGELEKFIL